MQVKGADASSVKRVFCFAASKILLETAISLILQPKTLGDRKTTKMVAISQKKFQKALK